MKKILVVKILFSLFIVCSIATAMATAAAEPENRIDSFLFEPAYQIISSHGDIIAGASALFQLDHRQYGQPRCGQSHESVPQMQETYTD